MANPLTVLIKETQFRIPIPANTTTTTKRCPPPSSLPKTPGTQLMIRKSISPGRSQERSPKTERYLERYVRKSTGRGIAGVTVHLRADQRGRRRRGRSTERDLRNHLKIKVDPAGLDLREGRGTEETQGIGSTKEGITPKNVLEVVIVSNKEKKKGGLKRSRSSKKSKKTRRRRKHPRCLRKSPFNKPHMLFQGRGGEGRGLDLPETTIEGTQGEGTMLSSGTPTAGYLN